MTAQVEEVALRLRADGVLETNRGLALTAAELDKVAAAATGASRPLQQVGVSAGQTQAAMRQLPAQITDIWTSLASGQAPMTVAIQQGGQIKDSFGGVVPAGRAMLGMLTPLNVAIGGTAATLGLLALAYNQGAAEGDTFARSIILTGNASGTTTGQMAAMARSLDAVIGTQGEAAEVLAQINSTGQVAASSLQRFTEVAMRLDRVGVPVADTVKQFAELGRSPVDASVKLNQQINYLTKSLYDQIVALDKQGRTAEAAQLAQSTYASAMNARAAELENRLGTLERAWRGIVSTAKDAWDAMLGIGREETVQEKISAAQEEVRKIQQRITDAKNAPVQVAGLGLMQRELDAARQNLANLRETERMETRLADTRAAAAARSRQQIADAEDARKRTGGAPRQAPEMNSWSAYSTWGEAGRREVGYAAELERQAAEDRAKAIDVETKLIDRNAQAVEREAATLANHTAELGLNAEQLLARRQALVDQQIGDAAALLSVIEGAQGYELQTQALRRQIDALQELRQAQGQAFVRQQVTDEQKAAEKTRADEQAQARRRTETIATSIEDGIMSGFRNGQSAADIFLNELKAQFARTVLRPIISPIATALGGGGGGGGLLGGLLGLITGGSPFVPGGLAGAGFGSGLAFGNQDLGQFFHAGGHAGFDGPTFTRALPASTWANAPRFHTGTGPDELPAVIKRTEGVFTEGQMRAMAPVSALAKAGPRINFSPTLHIDSRTDRAEVAALVQVQLKRSQAELLDMMERGMV
jgi:phage-related minor tail protein